MRIDKRIMFLKNLYIQIHEQCIIRYFENSGDSEVNVLRDIIGKCEELQGLVQKSVITLRTVARTSEYIFSDDEDNKWTVQNIDEALKKAYKYNNVQDEMNHNQHFLGKWVSGENPYAGLRSNEKAQRPEEVLSIDDVEVLFEAVLQILKQDLSIREIQDEVAKIFEQYHLKLEQD